LYFIRGSSDYSSSLFKLLDDKRTFL
jgi:hypothetical protein